MYADPDANALACSASGVRGGVATGKGKGSTLTTADAANAVLCVTFHNRRSLPIEHQTVPFPPLG